MKKTLLKLVALVVALAIAAFVVNREEPAPAPKTLVIAGYASPQDLQTEKGRGILDGPADIAYPIDEIVITKANQTVHMLRSGEGKDLQWRITKPMEASAIKFRVEKMVKLFKEKTASVHTKTVRAADHGLFDLEAERRIQVTLKAGGVVWQGADLVIGRVEESESQAAQNGVSKDTWVMAAGDEETAYRLAGKDLRTDFDVPLDELRDKKLFTAQPDDIVHITVTAPDGSKLVLDGARSETPASEADKPPKIVIDWAITSPAGFKADDSVKTFARHIANARTKAFVPASEGPKAGLGDLTWHLTARTHEGKTLGLRLADQGDPAWGQVDDRTEWVQLDRQALKNLKQTLSDLRNKTLWAVPQAQISGVSFGSEEGKGVTVSKGTDGWAMSDGGPADLTSHLAKIATLKAKRYAYASELGGAKEALEQPSFRVKLRAGERTLQLVVSAALTDGDLKNNRWATVDDGPPVLISGFTGRHFLKTREELQLKRFFELSRDTVQHVTVTHPDGSKVELERTRPGGPLELSNPPAGRVTKQAAVSTMVGTLPNLKAKTFEPATTLNAAGLEPTKSYRVAIRDAVGTEHVMLLSTETSGPDPYVVAMTGPLAKQVATISNFQALNLQKKASELSE